MEESVILEYFDFEKQSWDIRVDSVERLKEFIEFNLIPEEYCHFKIGDRYVCNHSDRIKLFDNASIDKHLNPKTSSSPTPEMIDFLPVFCLAWRLATYQLYWEKNKPNRANTFEEFKKLFPKEFKEAMYFSENILSDVVDYNCFALLDYWNPKFLTNYFNAFAKPTLTDLTLYRGISGTITEDLKQNKNLWKSFAIDEKYANVNGSMIEGRNNLYSVFVPKGVKIFNPTLWGIDADGILDPSEIIVNFYSVNKLIQS